MKEILEERGRHPGLVHIFSAMETCASFRPWHDKKTHQTCLKPITGKCLHYYFYFIDAVFGLCYVRVPTWAPFRLQVYFNGHNWLARRLDQAGVAYEMADNAFLSIADVDKAQGLADRLDAKPLHRRLNRWATEFCPSLSRFRSGYHWSFLQAEYATDVLFRRQSDFQRAHSRFPGTVCRQRWTVRLGEVEPVFGQTGRVLLDITARTAHDGALKWTRPSTPRAARSILATFPSTCALPSGGRWSFEARAPAPRSAEEAEQCEEQLRAIADEFLRRPPHPRAANAAHPAIGYRRASTRFFSCGLSISPADGTVCSGWP